MKKYLYLILILIFLASCSDKEKKPFGAVEIEYDKVEGINKEGPIADEYHAENTPPYDRSNINYVEAGPPKNENDKIVEPTADMDEEADFGGIPVVIKE